MASALPRRDPLLALFIVVCGGVAADRWSGLPLWIWFALTGCGWLAGWVLHRRQRWQASLCFLLAAGALGGGWHHYRWRIFGADEIGRQAEKAPRVVDLQAELLTAPRRFPTPPPDPLRSQEPKPLARFLVKALRHRRGAVWETVSGRVQVSVSGELAQDLLPGDRVRIQGRLRSFEPPHNPGQWDRASYYRGQRVLCELRAFSAEQIDWERAGAAWRPSRWLARLRRWCGAALRRHLPPPQADMAAAVLLGDRELLEREKVEVFLVTGVVHLLAISGLHVGVLAFGVMQLLGWFSLSRRWTIVILFVSVFAYANLVGGRPPVMRASTLILAFCAADVGGRKTSSLNLLSAAGLIVLAFSPGSLFQAGAQLSFLAVLAISSASAWAARKLSPSHDPLDRLIAETRPWPQRWGKHALESFGKAWWISTAIWLAALPLTMQRFHVVAFAGLVLNLLAIPLVAVALFAGMAVLLLEPLSPMSASVAGAVCSAMLWTIEALARQARDVPGSHFWTPGAGWGWTIVFYLGLYGTLRYSTSGKRRTALLALWLASVLVFRPTIPDRGVLKCTFLSVGHGLCVVVETPDGRAFLYDAGCLTSPEIAGRAAESFLWSRGRSRLDAVFLSHADADHYNAVPMLLKKFSTDAIYTPPRMLSPAEPSDALAALEEALRKTNAPRKELCAGQRITISPEVDLKVLHPPAAGVAGSDNANSLVLLLTYQGRRILLTGDLEPPGLEVFLQNDLSACGVLSAPHHGSLHSLPHLIAAETRPQWVVASGGKAGDLKQLAKAFQVPRDRLLHTAECGAVQVEITAEETIVRSWRWSPWRH